MNFLEYGDDLEEEMSAGKYGVYIQGDPVTTEEIEDYIAIVDGMAKEILRDGNTWTINMDTYYFDMELTEDATSMTVLGSDIPFVPGYVFYA